MPSPSRAHRTPRDVLVLLIVLVPVLAGCLRYTESLTIHQDDTVSGVIVIAAREPDQASASQAPAVPVGAALPEPKSDSERILVAPFAHEQESGYKVTFTRAGFQEVAAFAALGSGGGALLITRYGDRLEILMTVDLTYTLSAQEQAYIAEHADLTVSLEVPGEVVDTNGDISGDRITWKLKPFTVNTVSATVRSPADASPVREATHSVDPMRAALLGAGALVVLALGWFLLRRFTRPAASGQASGAPTGRSTPAHDTATSRRRREQPPAPRQHPVAARRPIRGPVVGAAPAPADPFGEPDPVISSVEATSRVRPVHEIDGGGWPPPRPLWREHR
jgi:hypothetical protein